MAGALTRSVGRLTTKNSILFLCDMQEKFRNNIQYFPEIVSNSSRVLQAFKVLDLPVVCTEQYPKGLGPTVTELKLAENNIEAVAKTQFSMCVPPVLEAVNKHNSRDVVVCGIECHVCVQQTALQLIEEGFNVHLVTDAVSSRSMTDRLVGIQRLRDSGAFLTTSEAVILGLAGGSHHPQFRSLQKIIMEPSADTGLLQNLKI